MDRTTHSSKKLRFAPLVRVSTEKQEKKGESLKTQTKQITQYVESLGGVIPKSCWRYSGQEHATPDQERHKMDMLLADASKKVFDAVIVVDPSRWSRDNAKSKAGLNILRDNGIRFFVGSMEQDLYDPTHKMLLGMSAEFGEYQAGIQSLKSIENRIEKAKKNIPSAGNLPYGRTWDKKTKKWDTDAEKVEKIVWAAEEYLKGRSMPEISRQLDMNHASLWKTMTKLSGTSWPISFKKPDLNINETVTLTIPALLPEETILAIKEKAKRNKTYSGGNRKNNFLLSGFIRCEECGLTMMGQANRQGHLYYRHSRASLKRCPSYTVKRWLRADDIETAVLAKVWEVIRDEEAFEAANRRANPDQNKIDEFNENRLKLKDHIQRKRAELKSLTKRYIRGDIDEEMYEEISGEINLKLETFNNELARIENALNSIPNFIEDDLAWLKTWNRAYLYAVSRIRFIYLGYEEKRKFMETFFRGKDIEGNPRGVYVRYDIKEDVWSYDIRGVLNVPEIDNNKLPFDMKLIASSEQLEMMAIDLLKEQGNQGEAVTARPLPASAPPVCPIPRAHPRTRL